MSWTDERAAQARNMWAVGASGSQIAAKLGGGLTREAVIGKAYRERWPRRGPEPPPTTPVALMNLEPWQCRWPVGGRLGINVLYCGAPAQSGLPYCLEHAAAAYTPRKER